MKHKFTGNESQLDSQIVIDLISEKPVSEEETRQGRRFRELLLEAVDESLSTLGKTPKQAVYFYLQESFNIKRRDIPDKIDEFTFAIERMFGEGARIIEIQIMKNLHEKAKDTPKQYTKDNGLSFKEYLRAHETV